MWATIMKAIILCRSLTDKVTFTMIFSDKEVLKEKPEYEYVIML